jgi:membrane protease YdiL (CAAX protease family)
MNENPWLTLVMIAAGTLFAWLWLRDFRSRGEARPKHPLPGATSCPVGVVLVGVVVGMALVAAETVGESWLGISQEQSTITPLFALWTLVAAIIEEIIFRGYFVIERRGTAALWIGIFAFSVVFAALHPFLWVWDDAGFRWTPGLKGWFSTVFAFAGSVAFYSLRFNRWYPALSLLPCFAAHLAKNAGVIVVKAVQGFVG